MKTKRINKLSLNKSTISNLGILEMTAINGGTAYRTETCDCPTNAPSCSLCPPSGPVGTTCVLTYTQQLTDCRPCGTIFYCDEAETQIGFADPE